MSALLYCFISATIIGVLGKVNGSSFYTQHPILTIKTEKGQVYDCVQFHMQPTFSNSSLKNHELKLIALQRQSEKPKNVGLKEGCPLGTVPILRTFDAMKSPTGESNKDGEHCTAVIRSTGYGGRKFFGASGCMSLWKPKVYGNQWSTSRVKLWGDGPDSIEAGWMVNPSLYKDSEAHLYVKFTTGSGECWNLQCPGFVQVATNVPLGVIPDGYTHFGDSQVSFWNISIDKHPDDGNWWLSIDSDKKAVGYWPKGLFTSLGKESSRVEWGGEIINPGVTDPRTEMGSGVKAWDNTKESSCIFQLRVNIGNLIPQDTERYEDCSNYLTYDAAYQGDYWGRLIFYGGY